MALAPETCVVVVINRGIAPFLDENGGLKVAPMVRPNVDYEVQLAWPSNENDFLQQCFAQVDAMGCTGMERFMKGWALAWGDPDPKRGWPKDEA